MSPHRLLSSPRAVAVVAQAIGLVLVSGVTAAAVRLDRPESRPSASPAPSSGSPSNTPSPSSTPSPSPSGSSSAEPVDDLMPRLQAFVEGARGLRFKRPVKVSLLEDRDYRRRILGDDDSGDDDSGEEDSDDGEATLRALELTSDEEDLDQQSEDLAGGLTAGFYDPRTKELVVRGKTATPLVRITLVHELTHALQDQHFGLSRPRLNRRDDEAALAFRSLAEGDAERIETLYEESLSDDERDAAEDEAEEIYGDAASGPPSFLRLYLSFPYQVGPTFVEEVLDSGGQEDLDAAFRSPPTTSEHLLNPGLFLAGERVVRVAEPPADGRVIDRGVLGQVGLVLLLSRGEPTRAATSASDGWGGDRYVTWRTGRRECTRFRLAMDSPGSAARVRGALVSWARDHESATVSGRGPLTVTACHTRS